MSCTVMYQPYAMSYSSSCDRTSNDKKSFKFPHAPSPPESSHSNASSSYSSPGSTGGGGALQLGSLSLLPPHLHSPSVSLGGASSSHNAGSQRRPLTPQTCASAGGVSSSSSSASATITSGVQLPHHHHHHHSQHHQSHASSHHSHSQHLPHHSHSSSSSQQQQSTSSGSSSTHRAASSSFPMAHSSLNLSASSSVAASRDLSHGASSNTSAASSHQHTQMGNTGGGDHPSDEEVPVRGSGPAHGKEETSSGVENDGGQGRIGEYLSANCIVYVEYDGNTARAVEDHFNRALSAAYAGEKSSKCLPMSTRNFPPSFWNSNYQPSKATLASYGAADFYGTAMDYSASIPGFAHHHAQADPWHYPLGTHHHHHHHQSYHHRPSDITYPPMSSTSRFNAAQYGSFLFPSTSAAAAAARFPGIPTPGQCSVKGDTAHHWAGGRYDGWSDLHLAADYSAAAAAHYSNMTAAAGLDFETHYLQSS